VLQTNNIELTRELHILQALLHNFELSVKFLAKTHNPAMDSDDFSDHQRKESKDLMKRESENLLSEIDRLEKRRAMLSNRLKNVMDLAFATVNIDDNSQTRKLTEATVRDSAAMKQVIPHSETELTRRAINGLSDLVSHDDLPAGQFPSSKHITSWCGRAHLTPHSPCSE
jgi:hypothetical protein